MFVYAAIRTLERTEKSGQTDRQTDRHIDQKQYTPARIAECNYGSDSMAEKVVAAGKVGLSLCDRGLPEEREGP